MNDLLIETERLVISSLSRNDYEIVTKLYEDSKNNAFATGVFGEISRREAENRTTFDGGVKTGFNLMAKTRDNGEFIGYLKGSLPGSAPNAWIYTLIVAPDRRRAGYGKEMVTSLESRLRSEYGVKLLGVSVLDENFIAKSFWESLGFRIDKTLLKSGVLGNKMSKINIYVKLF